MKQATHPQKPKTILAKGKQAVFQFWQKNCWHKTIAILVVAGVVLLSSMYGIAQWYIASEKNKPLIIGTSFIPAYAESLGLNAQDTLDALLNDAGVRHLRLVSYWDQLEPSPGKYDFSLLDWQFKKAEAKGAKITLGLGLRQPRWPECHPPSWTQNMPTSQWQPRLMDFVAATVKHYKNSPSLESYQLENEYFLRGFGLCRNFDRQRLVNEAALVKKLDPHHTLIIARSNNAIGMPIGQPAPDEYGISIYKRVWDAKFTHRYLEYPFPAWYYAFVAGLQKILTGRDMIIHELQAEAWPPNGKGIQQISLDEQNKSMNADRLQKRIAFAKGTGMRQMYLWGGEYWYYRKVKFSDPSLWNVAKDAFKESQ